MNTQISKYLPAWEKLKEEGKATIVAPAHAHKRIIKGIKQRRDRDAAFLFRVRTEGLAHKILISCSGNVIRFELVYRVTIYGL